MLFMGLKLFHTTFFREPKNYRQQNQNQNKITTTKGNSLRIHCEPRSKLTTLEKTKRQQTLSLGTMEELV